MTRLTFINRRLSSPPPQGATALAFAMFCLLAPTALRALVDPVVAGTTFSAYYPFVLLAALVLTWQSATVVAAASAVIGNFLFVEPRYAFFPSAQERFGAVLFMISAALVIAVANTLRRNVIDLHQSREREAHLNRELQHRVKNSLAVVQGLVTQTFRDMPDARIPLAKLQGRLRALADANDILRKGQWDGCALPELAVRALDPFNANGSISLVGPECCLPEDSCVPLVLALHELATNAVKHGALSVESGTAELRWGPSVTGGSLMIRWTEAGGPKVCEPTHRGLGSKLLRPQPGLESVALNFATSGMEAYFTVADVDFRIPASAARSPMAPATLRFTTA